MAPSFSSIKKKLSLHSSSSSVSLESVPSSDELSPVRATDFEQADPHTAPTMSNTTTKTEAPHHADANSPGRATFVLQAQSQDGQPQALGSSAADPAHPDVLADRDGAPVTSLPHTTEQVQGVLSSGERGLGPTGTATQQRMHATTQVGQGVEAVVGEAQGVAPEAIAGASAEAGEGRATEPWYRRIVKKDRSQSSLSPDEDEGDTRQPTPLQAVDALATVAPTEVTGADLSNVGLSENGKATVGAVTDKDGNPVPTKMVSKGEPSVAPSVTTSIKEQVSSEHSPDPHTSNERFHELFPSIPSDDELIEDYRCALQREILIQGRLFISERHLSFRANILGWETTVSIPWSEVTTIEKKMTAIVIPNAIEIGTPHARHSFASFINRDPAYELFVSLWRHAHPEAPRLRSGSESSTGGAPSELSYTDDEGTKKRYHFKPHIPSALKLRSNFSRDSASVKSGASGEQTPAEKVKADAIANDDGGHPPTEYDGEEFKNVAIDIVLPTSPELAYELFFTNKEFLSKFLSENQGVKELNMGDWKDEKTREMSYIKPLNAPMGPKETLVNLKDENEKADPETYYTTVTESHTPDVPSGSNFFVMTRTVITWSTGGGAHVKVTTEVTWTKVNRMLKGIIERSCLDGQKTYHKDLETAVREEIAANKAKYAVAGASESEESPVAATEASSEGALSTIASFLPSPVLTLSILVVILLFSNFFTLVSLRHQARALHAARLGSPEEVASAVQRILGGFSDAHGKQGRGAVTAARELDGVKALAQGIETQMGQLRDRLAGL